MNCGGTQTFRPLQLEGASSGAQDISWNQLCGAWGWGARVGSTAGRGPIVRKRPPQGKRGPPYALLCNLAQGGPCSSPSIHSCFAHPSLASVLQRSITISPCQARCPFLYLHIGSSTALNTSAHIHIFRSWQLSSPDLLFWVLLWAPVFVSYSLSVTSYSVLRSFDSTLSRSSLHTSFK